VLEGREVITALESLGNEDGEPTKNAVISDCGELAMEEGEVVESVMDEAPVSQEEEIRRALAGGG